MSKGLQIVAGVALIVVGALTSWAGGPGLIMAGISMIAGALLTPSLKQRIAARNIMIKSAVEPQEIVYGEVRKSGIVVWDGTSSIDTYKFDNEYLWYVVAVAGHEIDSFQSLWIDEDELNIDSAFDGETGAYDYPAGKYTDSKGTPLLYAWFHTGAPGQVVDENLEAAFSQWDDTHVGNEVAYVVVRMQLDTTKGGNDPEAPEKNVWYKGAPSQVSVTIRGRKVYDPRKDATNGGTDPVVVDPELDPPPHRLADPTTWEYSNNSVLCRADYLKDTRFGPGLTTIDWATVIEEANWAGTYVTVRFGNEPRYTMNGIIDTGDTIKIIVQQMQSADMGVTVFTPTSVTIKCGRWNAPTSTMDNSWLAGEMVHTSSLPVDNVFNAVRGQFADESKGYTLQEFQPVTAPAYETEDGGVRVWEDVTFSMTTSDFTAQRLAITVLKRGRRQQTIKAICNYRARTLVAHEVITWTGLGTFRITNLTSTPNGTVTVEMQEEVEDDWNYLVSDLAIPPITPSVNRYDDDIPPPLNLRTSTIPGGIQVYWDLPPMDSVQYVELYGSATDDRTTATLLTKGVQEGFYHELTEGDERYYWILSRGWNNLVSIWEPDSAQGVYGIAGATGADGLTVAVINTFYRGPTAPTQPLTDDGAYNFGTLVLTPPSIAGGSDEDWFVSPPTGVDPLYVSTASFSIIGLTGTDESCIWTSPDLLVSDGQPGDSIHVANVYIRSPEQPITPLLNDGAYNFTTHLLTPPSIVGGSVDDWFTTPPEGSDNLYGCTGTFSIPGSLGVDQTVTWTEPDLLVHDGAGYVPDFSPGYIGGTDDLVYALNQGPSLGLDGAIRVTGSEFYHPDGTFVPILTSPFGLYTDYDTTVVGKFYIMYSVEDFNTRFGGAVNDWGWGDSQLGSIIRTDAIGWQAIDKNGLLTPFTPLPTDCILAICEKQAATGGINSIQIMTGGQGTIGLDGQSVRVVTAFRYNNQAINASLGEYDDPLQGNTPEWTYNVPALSNDGDIAYSRSRTFTSDGGLPEDTVWGDAVAAYTRTNGVDGAIGQGTRDTTLYKKTVYPVVPTLTDDTSGDYLNPIGLNVGWTFELPAITDNLDNIYSVTRTLTTDAQPPQDPTWSSPTLVLARVDGSDGVDTRGVTMVLEDQSFEYDADGLNPAPVFALITAEAYNITGTAWYQFLVNDGVDGDINSVLNTYTYTPQADFNDMPDKIEVHVRENSGTGTIVARDQTTSIGLRDVVDGVSPMAVLVTNEAHTLPAYSTGSVKTYADSGTDILAWEGTTQVPYRASLDLSPSFKVSVTASPNINADTTPQTISTYTRQYSAAGGMTLAATQASITFEVSVKGSDGDVVVFEKVQSFSKSQAGTDGENGLPGANGADGSAGADARGVSIRCPDTTFQYEENGLNPDPTSTVVTASAVNTDPAKTVYYDFYKNDNQVQNSTNPNYTYIPRSQFVLMPEKIECQIRENATSGTPLARDQLSMVGLLAGSDGDDAITIVLTNDAHTIPCNKDGVPESNGYLGSGTDINVWEGTNPLVYSSATTIPSNSFKVVRTNGGIIAGSPITVGYARRYPDASGMTLNPAKITYTVYVRNSKGIQTTFTRLQTFSKSIAGQDGSEGTNGATITAIFTPATLTSYDCDNDGTGYETYVDGNVYLTGSEGAFEIRDNGTLQGGYQMFEITATKKGSVDNPAYSSNNGLTISLNHTTGTIRCRLASTPYDETWTSDSEWADITATYGGVDYVVRVTYQKNKAVAPAAGAQVNGGRASDFSGNYGSVSSTFTFYSAGNEYSSSQGDRGNWLLSGSAGDYSLRADVIWQQNGLSTPSGYLGAWGPLSTTRQYNLNCGGSCNKSCQIQCQIKRNSDGVIQGSGIVTLTVESGG
jgi:hypothetical protein